MADNTTLDYPNELMRLSLSFLGVGYFAFIALIHSTFKIAYLANVSDNKITSGESVTSSILRAEKYFEDSGTDTEQLEFFWLDVARYGRVDIMAWAHEQGKSRVWNERFCGRNIGNQVCRRAAEYGHPAALQWLQQNVCSRNSGTSSAAARGGLLTTLQWARANGCEWNSYTCSLAAGGGHLSVLQWARENGCNWNWRTCSAAAEGGHLSVLQWVRLNGCDWNSYTCWAAAGDGHLSILQWARENGYDWNSWICWAAAGGGHLSILQWMRDNSNG